jgi:hypothetical protein
MHLYNGGTAGKGGLKVTGERNYFERVHVIGGAGIATPDADECSLELVGADENTFRECVFGSDTFDRGDAANCELRMSGGCMRNRFIDCEFLSYHSSGTTAGLVKFGGAGDAITRDVVFKNCDFSVYDEANAAAEVSVFIGTPPNNGVVKIHNSFYNGCTDWCAVGAARVLTSMGAAADTGGKLLDQNPS